MYCMLVLNVRFALYKSISPFSLATCTAIGPLNGLYRRTDLCKFLCKFMTGLIYMSKKTTSALDCQVQMLTLRQEWGRNYYSFPYR